MASTTMVKTRFEIVSRSLGSLVGGGTTVLAGLLVFAVFRVQAALSVVLTGAVIFVIGAAGLMSGMVAATKRMNCPHCGESNQILASVKEFACMACRTPYALKQAVSQLPHPHLPTPPLPGRAARMATAGGPQAGFVDHHRNGPDRRAHNLQAAGRTFARAMRNEDHRHGGDRRNPRHPEHRHLHP